MTTSTVLPRISVVRSATYSNVAKSSGLTSPSSLPSWANSDFVQAWQVAVELCTGRVNTGQRLTQQPRAGSMCSLDRRPGGCTRRAYFAASVRTSNTALLKIRIGRRRGFDSSYTSSALAAISLSIAHDRTTHDAAAPLNYMIVSIRRAGKGVRIRSRSWRSALAAARPMRACVAIYCVGSS